MPIFPPTQPRYKNIPRLIAPVLWPLLTGRRGSLVSVADSLFANMTPPPFLDGVELIPTDTPFVVMLNHYESPSAAAWWGPLLMSQAITKARTGEQREVHWLMAREWWYPGGFGRAVKQPITRRFFSHLAYVYGLVTLPPVLTGDLTRGEGVAGIRQALALTRGVTPQLVGLAPEGHTGPGGALKEPTQGTGLFLLLLTHDAIPCLPAAWYQDEAQRIRIRFGGPFRLNVPRLKDRHARDRAASTQVMLALAELLPPSLWGAYSAYRPVDK